MRNVSILAALFGMLSLAQYVAAADGLLWLRDLEQAKGEAKSTGKDLFILFTAPARFQPCALADREVFQQPHFTASLSDTYVLLKLDFNLDDSPADAKRRAELMQLRTNFLAPVLPTVVLAESAGLPYAFITGYAPETGIDAYLDHIAEARAARKKRDELLVTADSHSGEIRAQYLSDALACIEPHLGKIAERGDDPLLHFYADTVEQILKSDGSEGVLADKYIARRRERDEWISSLSVLETLRLIEATKNLDGTNLIDRDGALNYLETCLRRVKGNDPRWQLELSRHWYLEASEKHAEALANCRRLLEFDGISDQDRQSLLDQESWNLFKLGRIDEGIAHYDRRIQDTGDDAAKRLQLLGWKAQRACRYCSGEQSILICQEWRAETKTGTHQWLSATALLARELREADRHAEALELVKQCLKLRKEPSLMLDAAESYIALNEFGEASRLVAEFESGSASLADSPDESTRRSVARQATRIKELKKHIVEGLKKRTSDRTDE